MNENIMAAFGFKNELLLIKLGKCPFCKIGINPEDFRDDLSRKEFSISGLCQKCQDEVFK